jgi:hypothetical protein
MRFFSRLFPRSPRPRPRARPELEAFEDRCVPAVIAADFPGQGVVRFTDGQPQLLTSGQAFRVRADAAGDVLADFAGLGVWRYEDRTGWQQLSPVDAASMDLRGDGKVVAYFVQWGMWEYQDGTGWQQLVSPSATLQAVEVRIDDAGGVLANSNGAMWYHPNGGSWQGIIGLETRTFDIAGDGEMVFQFSGLGVWRYHPGGTWVQQTPLDAAFVKINAAGDVAVALNQEALTAGIYKRAAATGTWSRLSFFGSANALGLGGDGSVAASYFTTGLGLLYWSSDGTPMLLSAQPPDSMSYQD